MKLLPPLVSLLCTLALVYFLATPLTIGEDSADGRTRKTTLPALGHFFSPFEGFWQNAEGALPNWPEHLSVAGRKGSARIVFDERLVPHIFADNLADACFAQGYATAMNRLWQMDMIARLAAGRLSEVLGERTLEMDKRQRRFGMVYGARKTLESWQQSPQMMEIIQAYVDGVNTWIKALDPADYPIEFKLLGYQPEPWTPLKMALIKKYMDQTLCFGEDDVEATNALETFGRELFDKLYPLYNPRQSPVIPAGTPWPFKAVEPKSSQSTQQAAGSIGLEEMPARQKSELLEGSNNWAVSGSKTASGHPILCNDPHLRLTLPSIWFELQIATPDLNAYGVTVPGLPGILIGFNEYIAWGETNVGQDANDWYRIKWTDDTHTTYLLDGQPKQAEVIVEKIQVRGRSEPILDTVKWTVWGPVVFDKPDHPNAGMAMHWIGHLPPNPDEFATFLNLMKARNYDDYYKALSYYSYPAQNFVFASVDGDIAITVNGQYPVKTFEQGRFVQDGSTSAAAWNQWIPYDHRARIRNPERGFVASANQHSTAPDYPYYYHSVHFDDYRGRYINQRLASMQQITPQDLMGLQCDNHSLLAIEATPALLRHVDTTRISPDSRHWLEKMRTWQGNFDADLVEPILFTEWWRHCYEETFDEVLSRSTAERPLLMPENWLLVQLLDSLPDDPLFDIESTPEKESATQVVTRAWEQTWQALADTLAQGQIDWAKWKNTSIMHLAQLPAFSAMSLHVGGYKEAPNAISDSHGPSWRMVVSLEPGNVKAWGVFPGGQSGNPGSKFYRTGLDKWINCEYEELWFMKTPEDRSKKVLHEIFIN
ncbi:MAG: beta-lactam antibiotic acylase [Saprospiraceae bacterium]|nr:MAG: beta-lactam antibiotic acylase [Saprospiraceae bacterium]